MTARSSSCGLKRLPLPSFFSAILCVFCCVLFSVSGFLSLRLVSFIYQDVFFVDGLWIYKTGYILSIFSLITALHAIFLIFINHATVNIIFKTKPWAKVFANPKILITFFIITYTLLLMWITIFIFIIVLTFSYISLNDTCHNSKVECFDLASMPLIDSNHISLEFLKICYYQLREFCHSFIVPMKLPLILSFTSSLFIILTLINLVICLSSNRSRIEEAKRISKLNTMMNNCHFDEKFSLMDEEPTHKGFLRVLQYTPPPHLDNGSIKQKL